jgi:hypothetical protein
MKRKKGRKGEISPSSEATRLVSCVEKPLMAFKFIAILSLMTAHFPETSKLARCDEISSFQEISSRNKIEQPEERSGSEI